MRILDVIDRRIPSAVRKQGGEALSRARSLMFVALLHILLLPPDACAKMYVGAWSQAGFPTLTALICGGTYGFGPKITKLRIPAGIFVSFGSTFTISLPLLCAAVPQAPTSVPGETLPRLSGRVLVVDDNQANTMVIPMWLKRFGLKSTVVSNGHDALAQINSQQRTDAPFSWVLMDCEMPGMDGDVATRQIRVHETGGTRLPILAPTANV